MTQQEKSGAVTGLILAGGRGSRMGNDDKGLQLLNGMPLVQHVFNRLRPQVDGIIISANRHLEDYRSLGTPVWQDGTPDYAGPLAGLQTGLQHCQTPYLACVPCDSPFLPLDLIERLMAALIAVQADLAYAAAGDGAMARAHPVFCLMRAGVLAQLNAYLETGERKFGAWQAGLNSAEVHFDDAESFRNINSRDDLRALEGTQV